MGDREAARADRAAPTPFLAPAPSADLEPVALPLRSPIEQSPASKAKAGW